MLSKQSKNVTRSPWVKFIVGFIIPTIILLQLSGSSRLGPLAAMGVALAFPIGLEAYSLARRRRPSLMSVMSIVGIVLVGLISVFELGSEWLALKRSAIYAIGAIGLLFVIVFKPAWIEKGLDRVFEMEGVRKVSRQNKTEAQLLRHTVRASYALVVILALIAIASYVLTIVFMTAPAGSTEFNTQYAELRIVSLVVITVPYIIAVVVVTVYLVGKFQKLTGLDIEDLIKKPKNKS